METQRRSLPQFAAGLRCWHHFAVGVLDYTDTATLPPVCEQDVVRWLQIFNNPGTASNYLGHLRWACKAYKKDTSWSGAELAVVVKGLKKIDLRTRLSQLPEKLRLEEIMMVRMVYLASELGDFEFATLSCWAYLPLPTQGAERSCAFRGRCADRCAATNARAAPLSGLGEK